MSLDEDPRSDEGCKHAVHFYEAGDVELKVGRVLFRVHRDRLCERSEVFSDMFELSQGGRSGKDDVDSVSLHDDPDDFAILLDFIYELSVEYADAKECLQVALLGHKYEVALVTSSCVGYLGSFLPTGLTSRDFSIAQQYYDDPLMIPLVIRASRLFDIPKVVPWALYALAVHFGPNSGSEWMLERDEDRACVVSLAETIKDVSDIGQTYIARWNRNVEWFLRKDCSTDWWVEEDECWRRSELSDLENSGFLLYKGAADPLYDMHEAADFCCDGLCPLCVMGFDRLSKQLMLMLLGEIGETDW